MAKRIAGRAAAWSRKSGQAHAGKALNATFLTCVASAVTSLLYYLLRSGLLGSSDDQRETSILYTRDDVSPRTLFVVVDVSGLLRPILSHGTD